MGQFVPPKYHSVPNLTRPHRESQGARKVLARWLPEQGPGHPENASWDGLGAIRSSVTAQTAHHDPRRGAERDKP
jgi:hypothetical protein